MGSAEGAPRTGCVTWSVLNLVSWSSGKITQKALLAPLPLKGQSDLHREFLVALPSLTSHWEGLGDRTMTLQCSRNVVCLSSPRPESGPESPLGIRSPAPGAGRSHTEPGTRGSSSHGSSSRSARHRWLPLSLSGGRLDTGHTGAGPRAPRQGEGGEPVRFRTPPGEAKERRGGHFPRGCGVSRVQRGK